MAWCWRFIEDVSIQSPERVLINLCIDQGIQLIKNIIEIDVSNSLVEGCLAIGFMNGYDSKTSISEVERVVLFINSLVSLSENDYSLAPILKQHSPELYMAWLNSDKSINTLYTTEHVDLSLLMNGMAELDLVADGDGLVLGSSKLPRNIDITIRAIEENGSTFIGWYDEAGDLYSTDATTSVKLKDDMRLTAKFQSGYSITYNLAGGVNHPDNPVTYDSSDADIILKDPTKEGYVFAGWTWSYQPNPTKDVVIKSGSSGNKKFNANWKRIEDLIDGNADIPEWEIYRVQIPDAGSGEYVEITPINIEIDTVVLENIPAKVTPKRLYEITGSANPPKGKKAKIYFYLLDSEIPDSVSYSDVAMYHYVNSNWEKLPTYYDGPSETGVMHTFHAETTGFSLFAIVFESPVDSDSISSSKNTGSGNYAEYLRSVTNGGYVDFGTSPVVKGVTLPEGVSSKVVLIAKSNTPAPKGKEAYGIFEINIDKYPTGEKAVISFTIPLADLQKKGFTEKDICLYHFDGEVWTKLPTTYKVDGDKALYEAETTDFSPFAIMYEKDGAVSAVVSETPVEPEQPNDEPVSDIPENPSSSESQEAESPAPVLGVMLGALGAAVLMRRK
ncbi:MAG: PGF-pre-PGF domain-containing protein [Methanocorpusculum sp.]|nr:PGF-pre-PGF domain-containing protein [Methanocorpusculum sp.]